MRPPRAQVIWGLLGAAAAAWFAIWMLFFPQYVPQYFAWDAEPRYAQAFIGAGYIFRTAFFLNVAREGNWLRLRWIVWGNLVFTGTLLFATYWHLDQFHWNPFQTPLAHIWIVLYIFEPVVMIYLIPRGILRAAAPPTGGPLHRVFKAVPRLRHRHPADERAAHRGQSRLRRDALGVGAQPARRPDRRGLVPRLGGLVRDDGVRARLGRDPARGAAVHPQRRRAARDRGRVPRRLPARSRHAVRLRRRAARAHAR